MIMKAKRITRALLSLALALCLVLCVFVPASFAIVNRNTDELAGVCKQWIYASNDRFLTIQMDPKYVSKTDSFELYLRYVPLHNGGELELKKVPAEDILFEKKEINGTENLVIFVRYLSNESFVTFIILAKSLADADGNTNPQISYTDSSTGETLYSYKKYDGNYFTDAPYGTLSVNQGDKIRFSMRGPYVDEYKVYMDGTLISQGPAVFDISFDEAGEHELEISLNELLNTRLPVSVTGREQARKEGFAQGVTTLGEALKLLPLGILFSTNPLTLLPAGAIFGGIFEGLAGVFKAIFGI